MATFNRSGTIIDIVQRKIYPGTVEVVDNRISKIHQDLEPKNTGYILPGFIDAHIHIESSMLPPSEFARIALTHGTVATVSDPHEIANVLGLQGIRFMIENGKKVPFHFYFGASSCVPATKYETSGASITPQEIEILFKEDKLHYLSEMMNFPGVLSKDPEVMQKIEIARKYNKPIDGHAPQLRGEDAKNYISSGISTDHECVSLDEAIEKIKFGMKILIREGSAAKNYDALHPLIAKFPKEVMFCSDDKHPHELVKGHIDQIVKHSIIHHKYDLMDVLRIACCNPVAHYHLEVGLLQKGDFADFIVIDNPENFKVIETYIRGSLVAKHGKPLVSYFKTAMPNQFSASRKKSEDFKVTIETKKIHVIEALDGQLITKANTLPAKISHGEALSDIKRDLLKLTVVNRYQDAKPSVGFIKNFGLQRGAIASSVAHDSHNIIAVGCNDEDLCKAVNTLIEHQGGLSVIDGDKSFALPLPIAGLMSIEPYEEVSRKYIQIESVAKRLGSSLKDPFMTLSFMALLVIPEIKLSDLGLFDGNRFKFISLEADAQL